MSQTATLELQDYQNANERKSPSAPCPVYRHPSQASSQPSRLNIERPLGSDPALPPPVPSSPVEDDTHKWNHPRANIGRTFLTFYSLFMCGANDAAYGALIPFLESYYDLSYTIVSLIFLSPFVGYACAALSNNLVHMRFGLRGIALASPLFRVVAYTVICLHPPYPVVVVIYAFAGYGIGLADAAYNAYVGSMANANEILGFMHGFYGLGATLSPLIATTLITKAGWPWYAFYYILIGGVVLETILGALAFWPCDAAHYKASIATSADAHDSGSSNNKERLRESLLKRPAARITWLCSFFLMGYVGVEVALGGWIVIFMRRARSGTPFASGMVATGFWLGITVGRVILGFITPRIGEKVAISIYLPISMAMQLVFWLVPQFIVSSVAVGLEGFFLGPLFPAAVVATTKLLPKHLHVTAIGFAAAFGGCGAAFFPFAVGAIANATSVRSLQPFILAMLVCILGTWLGLPRMNRKRD